MSLMVMYGIIIQNGFYSELNSVSGLFWILSHAILITLPDIMVVF